MSVTPGPMSAPMVAGMPPGSLALLVGAGVAALVALAWGRDRRGGAWWALLALVAAGILGVTVAGTPLRYQHVRVPASPAGRGVLAVLLLTGVVVAWRSRDLLGRTWRVLEGMLPGWRLPAVVVALVSTAATLSPRPMDWAGELLLATALQVTAIIVLLRAVGSVDTPRLPSFDWLHGGGARVPLVAAAFTTVVAAVLVRTAYENHPHVPDEVVYLLQADYLAAGRLYLTPPPVPEAFDVHLMWMDATKWFSPVPPGWPFILAIGAWFGVPWLVNPLLGGLNVVLAWLVVRETHGAATARLAAVLLATSPWHIFLSMSFMTHEATLTAALLAAWGTAVARRNGATMPALLGGLALGVVGLMRPFEGMIAALLLGFWSLGARGRAWRLAPSAALTLGTIASGSLTFPYNALLTGSARTFPIMMYTDRAYGPGRNALGFGADRGLGFGGLDPFPGHGPLDAVINANMNLFATNVELGGWAIGSIGLIALMVLGRHMRRPDWWMVAAIVGVAGAHGLYYYSGGPDFAARYWFLIIVPCVVLVARAIESIGDTLERSGDPAGHRRAHLGAMASIAVALVVFVPWRAADKYLGFRGMRGTLPGVERRAGIAGRDLVYLRGNRHPDYASAAMRNPIDLSTASPVYVWDVNPAIRREVARAFPDRRVWVMEGPSEAGGSFRVLEGPLAPGTVPSGNFVPADVRAATREP